MRLIAKLLLLLMVIGLPLSSFAAAPGTNCMHQQAPKAVAAMMNGGHGPVASHPCGDPMDQSSLPCPNHIAGSACAAIAIPTQPISLSQSYTPPYYPHPGYYVSLHIPDPLQRPPLAA